MKAYIDVENARTQDVVTYECPVLEFDETTTIKFDISSLTDSEVKTFALAISDEPDLKYTDIEVFFIDDDKVPYFGPDYDFNIIGSILIGKYNRDTYTKGR